MNTSHLIGKLQPLSTEAIEKIIKKRIILTRLKINIENVKKIFEAEEKLDMAGVVAKRELNNSIEYLLQQNTANNDVLAEIKEVETIKTTVLNYIKKEENMSMVEKQNRVVAIKSMVDDYIKAIQSQLEALKVQIEELEKYYLWENTTTFKNGKLECMSFKREPDTNSFFEDLFSRHPNLKETAQLTSVSFEKPNTRLSDSAQVMGLADMIVLIKSAFPKNEVPYMEIEVSFGNNKDLRKIKDILVDILADPKSKEIFTVIMAAAIKKLPDANAIKTLTTLYELQQYQKEQFNKQESQKEEKERFKFEGVKQDDWKKEFLIVTREGATLEEIAFKKLVVLENAKHIQFLTGSDIAAKEDPTRIYFKLLDEKPEDREATSEKLKFLLGDIEAKKSQIKDDFYYYIEDDLSADLRKALHSYIKDKTLYNTISLSALMRDLDSQLKDIVKNPQGSPSRNILERWQKEMQYMGAKTDIYNYSSGEKDKTEKDVLQDYAKEILNRPGKL